MESICIILRYNKSALSLTSLLQPLYKPTNPYPSAGQETGEVINIPGFDDIEPTIKLEDGESFVGLFDRTKEVKKTQTEKFGVRYTVLLLGMEGPFKGKLCSLSGGARLYDGIAKAIGNNQAPIKLRFTQHGARGTTQSTIEVRVAQ